MESNWRWNVWEFGFWGDWYSMIARLRTVPTLAIGNIERINPIAFAILRYDVPEQRWVLSGPAPIPADHPRFPYGIDVLPD